MIGPLIALAFVVVLGYLLLKNYNPHASLLIAGLSMLALSMAMGMKLPPILAPSGLHGFDLFVVVKESFAKTNAKVGLMIMAIGGFVAYVDKINASKMLVKLALQPLGLLKKHPSIAAVMVIPIGQLLFICIPSAAGLGLLLMASVYPILRGLGVSNLSAVSVITACTAFGMGPASAMTAAATEIAKVDLIDYFIHDKLPAVWPLTIVMMISYFFVNRYFDQKNEKSVDAPEEVTADEENLNVPKIYALIPVLPLILLVVFSELFNFLPFKVNLDTTTAMFISVFIGMCMEAIRRKSIKEALSGLTSFWNGMGNIFKTVVTLIIAADIFAKGLISLGFIDGMVSASQSMGLGGIGIGVVMTVIIFLSSMLMGSGNASFFAFGPLVPKIASAFGISNVTFILPMNMAASMGRTISPVAGVLIACAEVAGVTSFQIVKRNVIPIAIAMLFMMLNHFVL